MSLANWAGSYTYRARTLHHPSTIEDVQEIVASASSVRVLGSRHSFTGIGDSAELMTLSGLPADVVVDEAARTVSFMAGLNYGELAPRLAEAGVALANLASLPHISVAGAVATASHGSGDRNGNLSTAVAGLEIVRSDGSVMRSARGDSDFPGIVVGLGALGAVTRVALDIEPAYEVSQRVFEGLSWDALFQHFDAITASGYSVSVFTLWEMVDQVWVKNRIADEAAALAPEARLFGAVPASAERHPIRGMDPGIATRQLGVPGPWSDRLPHFQLGFTPSAGEELQTEYLVPRRHAVAAIEAVRALADSIRPLLQVSEIRTVAADQLWLSPQYGRDTVGIHFTWVRDVAAVKRVLVRIEAALSPFEARPHWGKLFVAGPDAIAAQYERLPDFIDLLGRLDPRGAFRNEWLETRLLGAA